MKNKKILENHMGYWLRFVSNQVSQTFAKSIKEFDVSVAEWVVLNLISEESLPHAIIANTIGMTRGATTKVLDKLLLKKLIYREESTQDRRSITIYITDKGVKLLPILKKVADRNDEHFFGHLSKKEQEKLTQILTQIVHQNNWEQLPID